MVDEVYPDLSDLANHPANCQQILIQMLLNVHWGKEVKSCAHAGNQMLRASSRLRKYVLATSNKGGTKSLFCFGHGK